MDFKSKGIAWVGDICQRFETMCQEVDYIVNQDPVKYVEDQVHTVGKSMKKLCSDVIQVRCEAQAVALKSNAAIGDYIKSMIGVENDHGHSAPLNQPPIELSNVCTKKNHQDSNVLNGCGPVIQSTTATSGESLERENSDSALGKNCDVSNIENSDLCTEGDAIKVSAPEALELIASHKNELLDVALSSEFIDSNDENACVSLDEVSSSTLFEEEESQPPQEVGTVSYSSEDHSENECAASSAVVPSEFIDCNNKNACVFLDVISSPISVDGEELQSCQKVGTVCYSPADETSIVTDASGAVVLSEYIDSNNENACVFLEEISHSTSVDGEELQSTQKVGTVCYRPGNDSGTISSTSSAVALSELALSVASSCGSIFTEPRTLPENSLSNILTKVVSYNDPVNLGANGSDGSNLLLSSTPASTVSSNKEVAEAGLTFSYSSNGVLSLESAGCSNDSSYVGNDFDVSGMETIDLSNKGKLEESCVMVDDNMLYEASHRIHKFRSLKKKFQDVFNSKKRLSKEYEQLAIWFGDLDTESNLDKAQHHMPSSATLSLDPDFPIVDSEWELL